MESAVAAVALATARVEAEQLWAIEGAVSMKAFLRHRCRMNGTDAGLLLQHGRSLRRYEAIADASMSSVLSRGHVRSIQNHRPKVIAEYLDECQYTVVVEIAALPVDEAEVYMAVWKERTEAVNDVPEPAEKPRSLSHHRLPDGSSMGTFSLDQSGAEAMDRVLAIAMKFDGAGDDRPIP